MSSPLAVIAGRLGSAGDVDKRTYVVVSRVAWASQNKEAVSQEK